MDPSKRLFDLIGAMSKQEKRYFKLYSSFYAKKSAKKCELLFDTYNRYEQSDDPRLVRALAKHFPEGNLPRLKNELTNVVLDSLVSFRSQHMMDTEVRTALLQVEVLLGKGLREHAAKLLEKAKKKAAEVENHVLQMQALFWERSLLLSRYEKDLEQQLESLYEEIDEVMQQQTTQYQYARVQDFTLLLWGSHKQQVDESVSAKLQTYFDDPLITDSSNATTIRAQVARLHILGISALSRNQMQEATELYSEIITLLESHPTLLKKNGNQYMRFMLQHLACLVEIRNEEDAARVSSRIKAYEQLPEHLRIVSVLGALGHELNLFLNLRRMHRAAGTVNEIETYLRTKRQAIHPQSYLNLCHNCMAFHFLAAQNSQALEYVNAILAENRVVVRKDIQDCARAYNLVLHYELGHTEILEHLFRSTYRYLKQNRRLESLEKTVLNHIRKLLYCVDESEKQEIYQKLIAELQEMRQAAEAPIIGMEEMMFWAQSKAAKRSIREVFENSEPE